jgi:hypothetical protein
MTGLIIRPTCGAVRRWAEQQVPDIEAARAHRSAQVEAHEDAEVADER